jgi:transposase
MEHLTMSRKERERLVIFNQVKSRELSRREAAEVLGLSLRQVHRSYIRFKAEGDAGLSHRSRGKPSPRRFDAGEREKALSLCRTVYEGFKPTLLAEKLRERDGIWVSHDTVRRWLIAAGLLERCRRGRRSRRRRERKRRFGQMVQMDGSPHAWFEDRAAPCVLMTVIDDATSRRRGWFFEVETMESAMETLGHWCGQFGVPRSVYVDRHGIYRSDREPTAEELIAGEKPVTQFGRAMRELNVELILARSPQAKGRVERSNGVLQDRLIKELKLAGVCGIADANTWLDQSRYFENLDEKFGVKAVEAVDAHRPLVMELKDVLCVKERRSVGLDGCVQWHGRVLQLEDAGSLRWVEIWERFDGTVTALGNGRRLSWMELSVEDRCQARAEKRRLAKGPIRNNKRMKPNARQQIRSFKTTKCRQPELAGAL